MDFGGFVRVVDRNRVDERDERDSKSERFHRFESRGVGQSREGVGEAGEDGRRAGESCRRGRRGWTKSWRVEGRENRRLND